MRQDIDERTVWPWALGKVISVTPLAIELGGHKLTGNDLLVNYQIIENEEDVTLHEIDAEFTDITGNLSETTDNITVEKDYQWLAGNLQTHGTLQAAGIFGGVLFPGDQVVLLRSEDGQLFVVLCKVVNVPEVLDVADP